MENYKLLKIIGEGSYGIVFKANRIYDNKIVAIKKFKNNINIKNYHKYIINEIKLLRGMKHINIVEFYDIIKLNGEIYLIMEYLNTNLKEFLKYYPNGIDNKDLFKKLFSQIVDGIDYLHNKNIIHRDLKPENILINRKGTIKICDFGISKYLLKNETNTNYISTRFYRSPELILYPYYNMSVDIWSLGCIMGEMLLGEILFEGNSTIDQLIIINKILGKYPNILLEIINVFLLERH